VSGVVVTGLAVTAVKGTRVRAVERIDLDAVGARGNRAFYVVDSRGRMVNGKMLGGLQSVIASYDLDGGELSLEFPDGRCASGPVRHGAGVETRFFSMEVAARELDGPWSAALSEFLGRPLRIVDAGDVGIDRGPQGTVSLISRGSLGRLAAEADVSDLDARRFRMLIEIDGVAPHEEDRWVGRRVRIGPVLVAMHGHVGRCLVTSRDAETGEVTLPTLDLLGAYRREVDSTEPLPFGIYGEVLEPGPVAVGDPVAFTA
jgi:hypothetical protein